MGTLVVGTEHYEVVATVGKGTFGEVTRGWRRSTGEMVAIKILKNQGHYGQVAKNELKLLQVLRDVDTERSHIIRCLDFFSDGPRTYLVFELLEQNLFDFQKQNNFSPLPVRHIRTITAQVLAALVKLKELSIIHADLKPENIMLVDHHRYPFRVKLIDFGSASVFADIRHVKEPYVQSRFYRAPEILLGLPFCEKMDIWSLGCVVAELHLGWPLYPGANEYDQVRYICSTLGLPRGDLLRAAGKTGSFFQRAPHPMGSWQLKPPEKELVRPVERRKYVFSSLDQLAAVNVRPVSYPGPEVLAEQCDLRGMVELVKRMLTWDSHKRIPPNAALKHPFISLQQLRSSFQATRYYQLCQEDLRASQKDLGAVENFPGVEEGAFVPTNGWRVQKVTTQVAGDMGDQSQQDICQSSIPTHHSTRWVTPQRHRRPEMDLTDHHLVPLRSPGTRGQHGHRDGGTAGGPYTMSHAKRSLVTPWPPRPTPGPTVGFWGLGWDPPTVAGALVPPQSQQHP
ncbi:homeodomain-interacting protein kinase 4 [Aegotheles albertisi]